MNIFEEELLLEVNAEQVKNTLFARFVDGRHVPRDIVQKVYDIDPTKKKSYSYWLLNLWDTDEREEIESGLRDDSIAALFDSFRPGGVNEQNYLQAYRTLSAAMEMKPDVDTTYLKLGDPNSEKNNFDIVYDTPEWKIIVPHSYEASKKLGKGCKWCTAGAFNNENDPYYYNHYTGFGPLWINLDFSAPQCGIDGKTRPYTRYQFCFEVRNNYNGEYMDYRDNRIKPSEIRTMPEAVKEFYVSQNQSYELAIYGNANDRAARERERRIAERRTNYEHSRQQDSVTVKRFSNDVSWVVMQKYNEEYILSPRNSGQYYLYNSGDLMDPISRVELDIENLIENDYNGFPFVVLNQKINRVPVFFGLFKDDVLKEHLLTDIDIDMMEDHVVLKYANEVYYYSDINQPYLNYIGSSSKDLSQKTFSCLRIVNLFKNQEVSNLFGRTAIELVLEDGLHKLYVKSNNVTFKSFIVDYVEDDYFKVQGGFIYGKYGKYSINGGGESYSLKAKLNNGLAIVMKQEDGIKQYNIFNSQEKEFVLREWYKAVYNIGSEKCLLLTDDINTGAILLSMGTGDITMIENITIETNGVFRIFIGTILNDKIQGGIRVKLPFSISRISFDAKTPEKQSILRSFLGHTAGEIRESFSNLYKRIEIL